MTLAWPNAPGELMVWAQLLLLWVVAMYSEEGEWPARVDAPRPVEPGPVAG